MEMIEENEKDESQMQSNQTPALTQHTPEQSKLG